MKPKDLKFVNHVFGDKYHYIFKQDCNYYIFTLMDDNRRGNFFKVSEAEIEDVKSQIKKKYLREFHPKELDDFKIYDDKQYRIQRRRSICYILVVEKFLNLEKQGREIIFHNIGLLDFKMKPVKRKKLEKNPSKELYICSMCRVEIRKDR